MLKLRAFTVLLFLFFCQSLAAQTLSYYAGFRPTGLNWKELKTPHFRIIYPAGEESSAYEAGLILENQYPISSKITGGKLKNFPFVLSNYNDLSNGFVSSTNFRSEFDLAPFKGKAISARSGNWLEAVLPHELLHAAHANVNNILSIGGLTRLFSPDLARTINFFPPVGMHEGLAVYLESNYVQPGGGRLNSTFFNNQFNSNLASSSPWSMAQTLQPSSNTLPYDRHYTAGATFMQWLNDAYGENIFKKSINFHYNYFFLGFGYALKHETKKWPSQLYREYQQSMKEKEAERLALIKTSTSNKHLVLPIPYKGLRLQKPIWISNSEIIYYGAQYNAPRGFYSFDLQTEKVKMVKETTVSSDFYMDYDAPSNTLLFSKYAARPLFSRVYLIDIHQLDVANGQTKAITKKARAYAPNKYESSVLGLQTHHGTANIISISENGAIKTLKTFEDATPISISVNPTNEKQIAVLLNRRGVQALWLTTLATLDQDLDEAPTLAFRDGSIHDVSWHPTEQKLLFTADFYPAMNIYEYNLTNGIVKQITSSIYNAFEASYSPDGNAIAYSFQSDEELKIAVLERKDFYDVRISDSYLLTGFSLQEQLSKPVIGSENTEMTKDWKVRKYGSDFSWLKPRAVLPVFRENSGSNQFGMAAYSTDVLGSQTYSAEVTGIQNRLWYDVSYNNKTFLPGFKLRTYNEPSFFFFNSDKDDNGINDYNGSATVEQMGILNEEQGFSLSIPFSMTSKDLSRPSFFYFSPSIYLERIRYSNLSPSPLSNFTNQYKLGYYTQFNWRILSLPRDMQPSSGLVLFSSLEKALNDPTLKLTFPTTGNSYDVTLSDRWGHYFGIFGFISPLRKFNQSMRIDLQFLQQSDKLLYSTDTITPMGFKGDVFPGSANLGRLSARYAIPLFYPDNGGLLVPLHLSTVYLTAFSHTISDLETNSLTTNSRTIVGGGLHFRFKVANLSFDLGFGVGYEPSRNQAQFIIGSF